MIKQLGFAFIALFVMNGIASAQTENNKLTAAEKTEGWKLLFDGSDTKGWHDYNKKTIDNAWDVNEEALHLNASKKTDDTRDIVSKGEFKNFDLKMQWKISEGGNSGIIFLVHEAPEYSESYVTGPEMQVLDNARNDDAKNYKHRAGDLYDLIASSSEPVHPAGEWNNVEIKLKNGKLDFYMNGVHTVSTTMWNANWDKLVKGSKFAKMPGFAKYKSGHIDLQCHGYDVWYRNIKIKKI
jgi:hypothetical protein